MKKGTAEQEDAQVLTVREACDRLRVGRTTLYELMDGGELAFMKIGTARRVPLRAVAEYIRRKTERTKA